MKDKLLKAIDKIMDSYDAYYFANKYSNDNFDNNTHQKEFKLLFDYFEDSKSLRALNWILNCYDCYYKNEFVDDNDSPFANLKAKIGDSND